MPSAKVPGRYVGRYAPSPTGPLHLGNLLAAVAAWVRAKQANGRLLLRLEDLDEPRCQPQALASILASLKALGFTFDDAVMRQSTRLASYQEAIESLKQGGHLFACQCSRKDIALAASAPHAGDEGPIYPGTCSKRSLPFSRRQTTWRFVAQRGPTEFVDQLCGPYQQDVAQAVGDFVVQRKDDIFAYQLAVVVDDITQGITEVVRGRDLLSSTPRQIQLYRALGARIPAFAHTPLWVGEDGHRLAKRNGDLAIDALLASEGPGRVLGRVGRALGVATEMEALDLSTLTDRLTDAHFAVAAVHGSGPLR